jgi:hypothetical protein
VRLNREYPSWGAPKIREKLRQQFTGPHLPAISRRIFNDAGKRRTKESVAELLLRRPTQRNCWERSPDRPEAED